MDEHDVKAQGPAIALAPVDIGNYYRVLKLKVAPGQVNYLGNDGSLHPNAWALAESAYAPGFAPHAVFHGEEIVGLIVWGPYHPGYRFSEPPVPGAWILDHVMIDIAHQGKGLGAAAIAAALPLIFAVPGCRRIVLSHDADNTRAGELYARLGFRPCGVDHEGAPMMELLRP